MNNKSGSVNSGKFKKVIAAFLAIFFLSHLQAAGFHPALQQQKNQSRKILPQQIPTIPLIPMNSWMPFTNRRTKSLQNTKIYGTKPLAL